MESGWSRTTGAQGSLEERERGSRGRPETSETGQFAQPETRRTKKKNEKQKRQEEKRESQQKEEELGLATLIGEEAGVGRNGRRRRADLGSIRFSERDQELLELIGEQYAISVEQLAVLSGRSYAIGRWLRDRWRKAGWVESRQLLPHGPAFVWLTREGTRVAQSRYRTWNPNPSLIGHIEAVTEVRLTLERQLALGVWECERSLAKAAWSRSQRRPHLPDAVLETAHGRIAIEVELHRKSRARLDSILAELAQRYPQIWYFAAPPMVPLLRALAAEGAWRNITVHTYPPVPGELTR